eukprot:EG_transcript_4138
MPGLSPVPAVAAPFRRWADVPHILLANFPQDQAPAMLGRTFVGDPPAFPFEVTQGDYSARPAGAAEAQQSAAVLHKLLHHVAACPALRPAAVAPPPPPSSWQWPFGGPSLDVAGGFASPVDILLRQVCEGQEQQRRRELDALRRSFDAQLDAVRRGAALPREAEAERAALWADFLRELALLGQWEAEVRALLLERARPALPSSHLPSCADDSTAADPPPKERPKPAERSAEKKPRKKGSTKVHPGPVVPPLGTAVVSDLGKGKEKGKGPERGKGKPPKARRCAPPPPPALLKPHRQQDADPTGPPPQKREARRQHGDGSPAASLEGPMHSQVGTPTAMLFTEATGSAALMAPELALPSARDRDYLATLTAETTTPTAGDALQKVESMSPSVGGDRAALQAQLDIDRLYFGVCRAPSNGVTHVGRLLNTDFSPKAITTYTLKLPEEVLRAHRAVDNPLFQCQEICPAVFLALRALHGLTAEEYALAWPEPEGPMEGHPSAGRSGAHFLFSRDGRFLFKTIPSSESATLVGDECRFLREYYGHLQMYPTSLLQRLFGLFRFRLPSGTVWGIVLGNLFLHPGLEPVLHRFDLKGRRPKARKTRTTLPSTSSITKDNALERQFTVPAATRDRLLQALRADLAFLVDQGVMDYSLLVGVAPRRGGDEPGPLGLQVTRPGSAAVWVAGGPPQQPECYTLGIADCLTRYGAKKVAAHFFKAFLWDDEELSTVKPPYYAARLETFVGRVFV